MSDIKTTAIVLAAGQGKRMQSKVHKQYLMIQDRPVLYYSLKAFEDSIIDDIVLVVGKGEEEFCREEILKKYGFRKVREIVEGGKERYHSVAYGIRAICWSCDYVFIHDGARPLVNDEIITRAYEEVKRSRACIVGMPVKDTIKISDEEGYVADTPIRSKVWQIQTPQAFEKNIITPAYEKLLADEEKLSAEGITVTDDAMVVEYFMKIPVKLVKGSYENIKITTPEDLKTAEILMDR
ncbi:MAG: 2-C-methyl-D-erythritol 4-phosphate cytidylyltransferase [Lachnospiraceae bacterium]|nr:2-C-methyl-D-erythritol 4-phosphate cytidylyltransferase [Lachnospiraceae bacterium]MBO5146859.1 2-C-methyl-D-erythritol 4-phosphate cytidylyltransferase [Lachnospiraceae bacterium]